MVAKKTRGKDKKPRRKSAPKAFHEQVRDFLGEQDAAEQLKVLPREERTPIQEEAIKQLRSAERLLKAKTAHDSLVDFVQFMMPDPQDPDDPNLSRYDAQYFHRAVAAALEEVERSNCKRLILTIPPRHGKTQLASRALPAWVLGRDPYKQVMFATYNEPFAEDIGKDVREIMQSPQYRQVFPNFTFRRGSASSTRMQSNKGGAANFVGRGGSITGRGADVLIIDDILKDQKEAKSKTIRDECWDWFTKTAMTRLMTDDACVIVIMTRWHEDDLVGRLIDPDNPYYNRDEAKQWKIINIPALAEHGDVLGRKVGEPLWPNRFGKKYLEDARARDAVGFSALYQQRPTPEDGDLITKDMVHSYSPEQLPERLRIYAASDHAIKQGQEHDFTVLLIVGVDMLDNVWVLDCWWGKEKTDKVVEHMIDFMEVYKPLIWWSAKDHISGSIGPFLYKRMRERRVFINVRDSAEKGGDKVQKAQPLIGRMAQGMVRLPRHAVWFEKAKAEMLKFPNGKNDDFVDALSHIGRGLDKLIRPGKPSEDEKTPKHGFGTFGWMKEQRSQQKRKEKIRMNLAGM